MDFFAVCLYLQIEEEALKLAMSDPRFPKPSRVGQFGEIEFADDDLVRFARKHPDILLFPGTGLRCNAQATKKEGAPIELRYRLYHAQ
jgi:hypothetical protein